MTGTHSWLGMLHSFEKIKRALISEKPQPYRHRHDRGFLKEDETPSRSTGKARLLTEHFAGRFNFGQMVFTLYQHQDTSRSFSGRGFPACKFAMSYQPLYLPIMR
ncbi:MAG: hypothetical protein U0103_10960 [Candidatus Obscuribacterales bacterium]